MKNYLKKSTFAIAIFVSAIFGSLTNVVPSTAETLGELTISNNWMRATPPAAMAGGGFLVIANNGLNDDTLVGVEFAGAKKSEIHEMKMADGIMRMRPLKDGIVIPGKSKVELKPGGYHLMFMGLKSQLKDGQKFSLKLTFKNAGEVTLDFPVLDLAKGKHLMMHGN